MALPLLVLLALVGFGVFFYSVEPSSPGSKPPVTLGQDPSSEPRAPEPHELPGASAADGSRAEAVHFAPAASEAPLPVRATDGPGGIDVTVLDRSGGALLGSVGSLPLDTQTWVRLFLGRGALPLALDPLQAHEILPLSVSKSRTSKRLGWVTTIEPPGPESFIALAFGGFVVAAAPIQPDARTVELVADNGDFDAMYASVEGTLHGMMDASRLVRIRPHWHPHWYPHRSLGAAARSGQVPLFIPVEGSGGTFTAKRLPPGKLTVAIRAEASSLMPALHAAKEAQGLSALSMGAHLPNTEQWNLRLGVLRQLQLPVADMPLTLRPGENRNLGSLNTSRSAAVLLELTDAAGLPVDATGVDVMVLGAPGEPEETVLTWTFESSASLYPLHPRPTELVAVQGDLGALVEVQPEELAPHMPIHAVPVRLQRLGVLILPEPTLGRAAPRLLTLEGHQVLNDPRWIGSRYLGHEIRGRTMVVPAGAYRIESAGTFRPVSVAPAELVDAQSGGDSAR